MQLALFSLRGERSGRKKFFCKTNPLQNFCYPANQLHNKEIWDMPKIGALALLCKAKPFIKGG